MLELSKQVLSGENDFSKVQNLTYRAENGKIRQNDVTFVANADDFKRWKFSSYNKAVHSDECLGLKFIYPFKEEHLKRLRQRPDFLKKHVFGLCFGRGCSGSCVYCGGCYDNVSAVTKRTSNIWREPADIVETVKEIVAAVGVNDFYVCFDPDPREHYKFVAILEALSELKEEVNFRINFFGLPERTVVKAFMDNLSKSSKITISPESADEEIRKNLKTFYYSNSELEAFLEYSCANGINVGLFFSFGLPGHVKENVKRI